MGGVKIFENVFDNEYCVDLLKDSFRTLSDGNQIMENQLVWRTNYTWHPESVFNSHPVLIRHFGKEKQNEILQILKDKEIITHDLEEYNLANYLWTKMSYIPWHTDAQHEEAVTIFLNTFWDPNWGGYFMYEENNEIKAVQPKFNRAVKNKNNIGHAVSMVHDEVPYPRATLQIFRPRKGN